MSSVHVETHVGKVRCVVRTAVVLSTARMNNHSPDKELERFKKLILKKIDQAKQDLDLLKSAYMNDSNNGTDDTSPTFKAFEEGSETMSKEANTQLALRQEKFIRDLKNALMRIENKTYGICRVTGKLIKKKNREISINLKKYKRLNFEIKIALINYSIKQLKNNYYDLRSKKLENLIQNLSNSNFKKATLGGCIFFKKGENLCLKVEKL